MKYLEALEALQTLLPDATHWHKGSHSGGHYGHKWTLDRAFTNVTRNWDYSDLHKLNDIFKAEVELAFPSRNCPGMVTFNDHPDTTFEDISYALWAVEMQLMGMEDAPGYTDKNIKG